MFKLFKILGVLALTSNLSLAATNLSVVQDSYGNNVKVADGSCLRFSQAEATDVCNPLHTVYFGFDKHHLSQEAKSKLDDLSRSLNRDIYIKAHVMGYADRIGDKNYNKTLSYKRAETVAQYLSKTVNSHNFKVTYEGNGQIMHEKDKKCSDKSRSYLIECLHDDRKAVVAVKY